LSQWVCDIRIIRNKFTTGDIETNPGPCQANSLINPLNWEVFKQRGLHFIHLNINSLLPKIDELKLIAKKTNAAIIGITESKLDASVSDEEVKLEGFIEKVIVEEIYELYNRLNKVRKKSPWLLRMKRIHWRFGIG